MLCFYTRWIIQYNSFNEPHEKSNFCLKQSRPKSWKSLDLNIYFVVAIIQSLTQSVMSDSLRFHGRQHTRLSCPSPSSGVRSNACPLSWWCHPTISSSVDPISSCLQSFPASGSFPMSQFLHIRQPKYWSFSFNISPSNEYSGLISFRIDWLDLLAVSGTLKSLLQHYSSKA